MIHQHIKKFLVAQNKLTTETMTYCLLFYDPAIILLSDNIFMNSIHLNILSARNATSMNKISITDYANVLLLPS